MSDASGVEDAPIALSIGSALADTDGSETLSVVIGNVPTGATLSAGTDNGDGTWSLTPSDLDGLTVTPPSNYSGSFDLTVTAISAEADGDTATTNATITVDVSGVADAPSLTVQHASGAEDTPVGLDITPALSDTDGSETLSVVVGGVPTGATLSAGMDNGDGTWTLTPADLDGLTVTPPSNFSGSFDLSVTAISAEADGDTATTTSSMTVEVSGVADAPALVVSAASGFEDAPIGLDIAPNLTDTDGSESLSIVIGGVPTGATLSAGVDNGDGTWTLAPSDLDGLRINPPSNYSGSFDLTVTATSTEADGDSTDSTSTLTVEVASVTDAPSLTVSDASGAEDTAISLDIAAALTDPDGPETLDDLVIGGVPTGATLSAGTDNGDGTWTLAPSDLDGLRITPPEDFAGTIELTVTASATDADGQTAVTTGAITVEIEAVADTPALTFADADGYQGNDIPLVISSALTDTDGSETLTITISNVPRGATLSAGTNNGDGTWTLSPDDLTDLTIRPQRGFAGLMQLDVTATSVDGESTAISEGTIGVRVHVAETPEEEPEAADPEDKAPLPTPNAPGEIDWDGDLELGVIGEDTDFDGAFDEIGTKLGEIELADAEIGIQATQLGNDLLEEISPIVAEAGDQTESVPPPDRPLYEFVRAENADQIEEGAARRDGGAGFGSGDDASVATGSDAGDSQQDRFSRAFTMLWGLVRSLGVRNTNDEQETSQHASRGRRG